MNRNNKYRVSQRALQFRNALSKKTGIIFLIIMAVLALILFYFSQNPYKLLVIEDMQTGETLWKSDIKTDEWFYHQYVHSVERSTVIEKFRVDQFGQIYTMESWTRSFGAGLPYEQKGNVQLTDGFYVLKDLNSLVHGNSLNMHPSTLFPHTFHFRDDKEVLSDSPYAHRNIKITIKSFYGLKSFTLNGKELRK